MDKLNGSNWSTWKFQMTLVASKKTLGYVDGTEQLPGNANAQTRTDFQKKSQSILHNCYGHQHNTIVFGYFI